MKYIRYLKNDSRVWLWGFYKQLGRESIKNVWEQITQENDNTDEWMMELAEEIR